MNTIFYRHLILFFIITLISKISIAQESQDTFRIAFYEKDSNVIVKVNLNSEKYGCESSHGDIIIPYEYDYIGRLNDGLRLAVRDQKYGYLNQENEVQINFDYLGGTKFINNKAIVITEEGYGVVNQNNEVILPFKYGFLRTNDHKFYIFKQSGGLMGVMSANLDVIVSEDYDNILLQNDSIWMAMKNRKFQLFKQNGTALIHESLDGIGSASYSGYKSARVNGKVGVLDEHFQWVLPPQYKAALSLFHKYIGVKDSTGWKVYNAQKEMVFSDSFDQISFFNKSLSIIEQNNRMNIINVNGEKLLPLETKNIIKINGSQSMIYIDGYLYSGLSMNKLINEEVRLFSSNPYFENGFLPLKINKKCAVIDTTGQLLLQSNYQYCDDHLRGTYLKVVDEETQKWGLINLKNELIVPTHYDYISFNKGLDENAHFWLDKEQSKSYFANKKILIENIDSIIDYVGDFTIFKKRDQYGFINSHTGKYRMLDCDSIIGNHFPFIVIKNGKYGSLDYEGNLEIPYKYDFLQSGGNHFVIKSGDHFGTISRNNEIIEFPKYDKIEKNMFIMYSKAYVEDKIGLLDPDGRELLPIEYDAIELEYNGNVIAQKGAETYHFNCIEMFLKSN